MIAITEKSCSKCNSIKKIDEFYNKITGAGGKQAQCKNCHDNWCKGWNARNKDKVILSKRKSYRKHSKAQGVRTKGWRLKNPKRYKEISDKWYQDNKARKALTQKRWRLANKDKDREAHKIWRQKNKERTTNYFYKHYLALKETDITPEFLKFLKESVGGICPYCLEPTEKWHLDHMVSIKNGGSHTKDNVMYCCATCNQRKNAKNIQELDFTYFSS